MRTIQFVTAAALLVASIEARAQTPPTKPEPPAVPSLGELDLGYRGGTVLKVVKCDDAACAPGGEIFATIDSSASVGEYTSLALGTDGFPVIAYYNATNGHLKVAKCNDATCSSVTLSLIHI